MPKFTSATAPRHKAGEPRKPRQKKEPLPVERKAYSIPQFCQAHEVSRSGYYELKAKGQGPDETQFTPRGKITISEESAARWREKRLAESVAVKVKPTLPAPTSPAKQLTPPKAKPTRRSTARGTEDANV